MSPNTERDLTVQGECNSPTTTGAEASERVTRRKNKKRKKSRSEPRPATQKNGTSRKYSLENPLVLEKDLLEFNKRCAEIYEKLQGA